MFAQLKHFNPISVERKQNSPFVDPDTKCPNKHSLFTSVCCGRKEKTEKTASRFFSIYSKINVEQKIPGMRHFPAAECLTKD